MGTLKRQLCLVSIVVFTATAASAQSPQFSSFSFKGSDGTETQADSATLMVPVNRTALREKSIAIPIVRFKSTSGAATPIIYLSGGTGSGIAAARGKRLPMFLALREIGDVVTFDIRGAGRSTPRVFCAPGLPGAGEPQSYESVVKILTTQTRGCADSLRASGVDLDSHNIREVVNDIDDIRKAIGARKIILLGISTGTQIALEYMRRYPSNVERAIIAGVQAPNQTRHLPAEQEKIVRSLPGDVATKLKILLDSLAKSPARAKVGPTEIGISAFDVQLLVAATLGDRQQMSMLPAMIGAALQGNFTPFAQFKFGAARQGITSAYESLMDCQSGAASPRQKAAASEANTALLGRATLDFPEVCSAWGVKQLDDSYRQPVKSSVPTLLISGTLDGRTPVANADEAMRTLRNSHHVVINGASHGDDLFLSSPVIVGTMLEFLRGKPLPKQIDLTVQ